MTTILDTGVTHLALHVTAAQPLAVGRAPETGQLRDAHEVVPGSVVRGALAARWIRRHGPPDRVDAALRAQFVELFESGTVRCGPLFPDGHALRWLSCLVHKYGRPPGCEVPDPDLADSSDASQPKSCTGCGEALTAAKDGIVRIGSPPIGVAHPPVRVDRVHAQIGADDRPVDGNLFTRRSIRRGTRLSGLLCGPPVALARLRDDPGQVLLGGNRTASGRVTVDWAQTDPPAVPPPTRRRLVLRLHTPAIFVDGYGRPARRPDLDQLSALLGVAVTGIPREWVRTEAVGGWHAASGLPKPTERAVVAGSVYLVDCAEPPTPSALGRLAAEGVGLRRHEGFGWVAYRQTGGTG